MTTVSVVEMSVGLRSAARLLVLRSRQDVASRRERGTQDAFLGDHNLTATADVLNEVNSDGLCLACERENATGRGVLSTQHSCADVELTH